MKIVSACLAGKKCAWDGRAKPCRRVIELVRRGEAIPVCPEELGGLGTPREPSERRGDGVVTKSGKDVTAQFEKGAEEALAIALAADCDEAILKSKSPACGCGRIYDGTFSGRLVPGDGVFTEALKEKGIGVVAEEFLEL